MIPTDIFVIITICSIIYDYKKLPLHIECVEHKVAYDIRIEACGWRMNACEVVVIHNHIIFCNAPIQRHFNLCSSNSQNK